MLKDAQIVALQEVNRHHRRTAYKDMASELARALSMCYVFGVENPYKDGDGERGLAILSRFPFSQIERIPLPHTGPRGRNRIAVAATIHLGPKRLRIYSVHLETRISNQEHTEQLLTVLNHATRYGELPTVILGDFNTIRFRRKRMFALMKQAGFHSLPNHQITFQRLWVVRRKLDWIWVRNLDVLEAGVVGSITASDHRPVWALVTLRSLRD